MSLVTIGTFYLQARNDQTLHNNTILIDNNTIFTHIVGIHAVVCLCVFKYLIFFNDYYAMR